jgi:putative membrane protein
MFWHDHMNTGGWVFMVLGNIVIWGLIFAFIIWLVQDWRGRQQQRETPAGPTATEILDRRLASGEIDTNEYERLRNILARPPGGQTPGTVQSQPTPSGGPS